MDRIEHLDEGIKYAGLHFRGDSAPGVGYGKLKRPVPVRGRDLHAAAFREFDRIPYQVEQYLPVAVSV